MTTKAILQTAGDGTTIPSGYVGESYVVDATSGVGMSTTIGAFVDIPGATFASSLTPGVWRIVGQFSGGGCTVGGTGALLMAAHIRTAGNTTVKASYIGYQTAGASSGTMSGTLEAIVNITSATNYKLSLTTVVASGSPTISSAGFTYSGTFNSITAVRIA